MVHSKEDIVPGRSVPQAVAQPYAKQGDGSGNQGAIVAAQTLAGLCGELFQGLGHGHGVEDVVLELGAQGDMPALPELRNGT